MVGAMGDLVPEEMRGQLGPMQSMVATLGGALFGGQLGQALGSLAAEVLSAGDIGLPLGPAGTAALLPANIAIYGDGLQLPADEVRLYVSLREAAHQRLFGHVPWLRGHVLTAVEAYAAGIRVNRDAIEEAMGRFNPGNPEAMQDLSVEGLSPPDDTPQQQSALARLETALALVEGWVCHVVDSAAGDRLPDVARLAEAFRRRRAAGGAAAQTLAPLLRPPLPPPPPPPAPPPSAPPPPPPRPPRPAATPSRPRVSDGARDTGGLDSGRSSLPTSIPGRSGASGASNAACWYPSRPASPKIAPLVSAATSHTRVPGQTSASARARSAGNTATAGVTSASVASRSTTSSASARRHASGSTPGWLQDGTVNGTTTTRRVTPSILVERLAAGRGDPLQAAARPFGPRVPGDQGPEPRAVAGHHEVDQLVQQHVVDHPVGHVHDPVGNPGAAVRRGARAPAAVLVAHPADAGRPPGRRVLGEVAGDQALRAAGQLGVGTPGALVPRRQALQHPVDPFALLGAGELARDEDHDALAVAVGGHRAAPALAAPHFDYGPAGSGHDRAAHAACPRASFTWAR